ncbi:hypothetical protein [Leptodesmis sichuanensis]|uniref:hypothetical protein n=1 Tax=Leptodesmis sichuanensis TaxID=2906798 RepID=UPI001F3D247F|nr:hypothetical protein [Leptodesmis sichuanensis]UIE36379.1 hypothetical protein KIK02_15090 [Leptodesmis sichuanensis A121]
MQSREGGVNAMLERKTPAGDVRQIPQWAEAALAKRLKDPEHGFASYGAIQQWLAEELGIEAQYHAVDHMTRYRLQAKLKAARPQHVKQNSEQRELFKKPRR